MGDLEKQSHWRGEGNSLLRHECEHFVVVHDSVERFNPLRINITIEYDPLVLMVGLVSAIVLVHVSHDDRQDAILPLFRLRVHATEKLIGGDCLWIDDIVDSVNST